MVWPSTLLGVSFSAIVRQINLIFSDPAVPSKRCCISRLRVSPTGCLISCYSSCWLPLFLTKQLRWDFPASLQYAPSLRNFRGVWRRDNMIAKMRIDFADYPLHDDQSQVPYPCFNKRPYLAVVRSNSIAPRTPESQRHPWTGENNAFANEDEDRGPLLFRQQVQYVYIQYISQGRGELAWFCVQRLPAALGIYLIRLFFCSKIVPVKVIGHFPPPHALIRLTSPLMFFVFKCGILVV